MESDSFIPLSKGQEEAYGDMYLHFGYIIAMNDTLKYMEENFGKAHKHTINLRILLQKKQRKLSDDFNESNDESGLSEILSRRID